MPSFITYQGSRAKIPYKKLLQAKPKKSENVEWDGKDPETLKLYVPYKKTYIIKLLSRFMEIPDERTFRFNQMGTMVWDLCDGTNTIEEIKLAIMKRSKGDEKDIERRLIKFINKLSVNELITLEA